MYANELVKGGTKAEPIEGDYEEEERMVGANGKKGQAFEPEENFDDMMVDEGVTAHMRWTEGTTQKSSFK